ncbi:MAG: hypothetical protein DRJ40_11730, partial [Thermoprotei archaeon]
MSGVPDITPFVFAPAIYTIVAFIATALYLVLYRDRPEIGTVLVLALAVSGIIVFTTTQVMPIGVNATYYTDTNSTVSKVIYGSNPYASITLIGLACSLVLGIYVAYTYITGTVEE